MYGSYKDAKDAKDLFTYMRLMETLGTIEDASLDANILKHLRTIGVNVGMHSNNAPGHSSASGGRRARPTREAELFHQRGCNW